MTAFDRLVDEAMAAPFSGWDFSWLDGRVSTDHGLPWEYRAEVGRRAAEAGALLDLGTGGGEWLAALDHRPAVTVATEGWPPNVGVAAARLRPLGVPVVAVAGAPDNPVQDGWVGDGGSPAGSAASDGRLPFRDGAFPLVIN